MKYIEHLQISFSKMIEIKDDLKKISIDRIYIPDVSSSIIINEKKDLAEIIKIYYEFTDEFTNIKNLKDFLNQFFYRIFNDIFEIFINNPNKYSPQYIKNLIKSDSEQSSQFLISLLQKHKKDTLEERKELHQTIKENFNEFYRNLFKDDNYLIEYALLLNFEDSEIEDFLFQKEDPLDIVTYYFNIKKIKSKSLELEKKLLKSLIRDDSVYINVFSMCVRYCKEILNGPWLEFEESLLKNKITNKYILDELSDYIVLYKRKLDDLNEKIFNDFENGVFERPSNINLSGDYFYRFLLQNYLFKIHKFLNQSLINQTEKKLLELKTELYYNFYYYSKDALKRRWKEQEDSFFNNETFSENNLFKDHKVKFLISYINYFKIRDHKLNPEIMNFLKTDYKLSYDYAYAVRKAIPELEPTIAKSFNSAFNYATKVLNARFPLGEKKILKSRKAEAYKNKFNL